MKTRLSLALFLCATCLLPLQEARAGFVLGPEAEGPVMRWFQALNVKLEAVDIVDGEVVARAPRCLFTLSHPNDAKCSSPLLTGNSAVCLEGKRCPSAKRLRG